MMYLWRLVNALLKHSKIQTTQDHYGQIVQKDVSLEMKRLTVVIKTSQKPNKKPKKGQRLLLVVESQKTIVALDPKKSQKRLSKNYSMVISNF